MGGFEMTKLRGATITDFKDALLKMKEIYPFDDDKTVILSDSNLCSLEHSCVEIRTTDENGTVVTLFREIEVRRE